MLHGIIPHMLGPVGGGGLRPQDVFATSLYTGNGATQTINNGVDLAGEGGLTWLKPRSQANSHLLFDTVRGISKALVANATSSQGSYTGGVTAFSESGFSIAHGGGGLGNDSGVTYASWSFRQADKFFALTQITHTTGTATSVDLGGLGAVGFATVKKISGPSNWLTWHLALASGHNINLNLTDTSMPGGWISVSGTTLTLSSIASSGDYLVYAWAHNPDPSGIVQCGSAISGSPIDIGWRPQFLLQRPVTVASNWHIIDSARGFVSGNDAVLRPDTSGAETLGNFVEPNSSGFTPTTGYGTGVALMYLAIREPIL
jgi:hypothetical protein